MNENINLDFEDHPRLDLAEGAVERKIYQLIHEYGLSYKEVRRVLEVVDDKLLLYLQNTEISKNKKPLDLTRSQGN